MIDDGGRLLPVPAPAVDVTDTTGAGIRSTGFSAPGWTAPHSRIACGSASRAAPFRLAVSEARQQPDSRARAFLKAAG
jgi:sugar/nucleoside kinase (ribokinase family)